MRYFVYVQPEGDTASLDVMSKEELENNLNEEFWGSTPILGHIPEPHEVGLCVIMGSIVMPEPIKVVETWRLP